MCIQFMWRCNTFGAMGSSFNNKGVFGFCRYNEEGTCLFGNITLLNEFYVIKFLACTCQRYQQYFYHRAD